MSEASTCPADAGGQRGRGRAGQGAPGDALAVVPRSYRRYKLRDRGPVVLVAFIFVLAAAASFTIGIATSRTNDALVYLSIVCSIAAFLILAVASMRARAARPAVAVADEEELEPPTLILDEPEPEPEPEPRPAPARRGRRTSVASDILPEPEIETQLVPMPEPEPEPAPAPAPVRRRRRRAPVASDMPLESGLKAAQLMSSRSEPARADLVVASSSIASRRFVFPWAFSP